ncbi:MAG: DUF285 domain-containing protein [Lactobacillaceae bacterium]|nr:DUF285 domain-containing protein [Lactobacillaceae bacterium]
MNGFKITKKLAQTLALLAVVAGGAVAPIAGVVIPGLQQSVAHASVLYQGNFNTSHWTIEDNGTLTIETGELGDMSAQSAGESPWYSYRAQITKVVIQKNVKAHTQSAKLFNDLFRVTQFDGLENLDTSGVENMNFMFANYRGSQLDVSHFNTAKVKSMRCMFQECKELTTLNLSSFETNQAEDMISMFGGCEKLTKLNVSNFKVDAVKNMDQMFNGCINLQTLDLTSWETKSITSADSMFFNCSSLWKLTLGVNFTATGNTAITTPVEGKDFNQIYKVRSTSWQEVGTTGTPSNPNGTEVTPDDLLENHATADKTETYVWQGTLGATTVDYTVDPSYTITIPATITISQSDKYGSGNVVLKAYPKLPYEESLIKITATSTLTNWHLKTGGDTTGVAYLFGTQPNGSQLSSGGWLTFTADGTKSDDTVQPVYASLPAGSQFKYAGSYTDTVNYTIETTDPNAR